MSSRRIGIGTVVLALLTAATPIGAQAPDDVRTAFQQWARKSLHAVSDTDLDASTRDLRFIETMIGDAKIVGLSEGIHAAAEPLIFRNRVFKHLVEHRGFNAIAMESGIVESRVLNDYVTRGRGRLRHRPPPGFLQWIRYVPPERGTDTLDEGIQRALAARRSQGASIRPRRSWQPGNFDAARGPDTALQTALEYLRVVDPQAAAQLQRRVETFLPVLKDINGYGDVKEPERDSLTAAIADLVSLMERQQLAYVEKSSKDDFEWAERAAIGARQTDTWFRRMPPGWKLEHGLDWTRYAMQVRDRTMADNLGWVLSRLGPRGRVLVFAASGHLASTVVQLPNQPAREMIPLGAHLKARFGSDFINILNLVANGEIVYCSANPRRLMPLKPPPASAVETLFAAVNVPRYALDLRRAPPRVSIWLHQTHDHWNGFVPVQFATAGAFDLVYYVGPVTSACVPVTGT